MAAFRAWLGSLKRYLEALASVEGSANPMQKAPYCSWTNSRDRPGALPPPTREGLSCQVGTPGNLRAGLFAPPRWWQQAETCLGRPQLGGFPPLAVHTPFNPVSPISFILKGQRPACLSLLIRAGFGLCGTVLTFSGLAFWNLTPNEMAEWLLTECADLVFFLSVPKTRGN